MYTHLMDRNSRKSTVRIGRYEWLLAALLLLLLLLLLLVAAGMLLCDQDLVPAVVLGAVSAGGADCDEASSYMDCTVRLCAN